MPTSKHRRKHGGKSIKHPGQSRASRTRREQQIAALLRVATAPSPFHSKAYETFGIDGPHAVTYMADLLEGWYDGPVQLAPIVAMKDDLFTAFIRPLDVEPDLSDPEPTRTLEDAQAALALLEQHEFVIVDGERVTIHPRFTTSSGLIAADP